MSFASSSGYQAKLRSVEAAQPFVTGTGKASLTEFVEDNVLRAGDLMATVKSVHMLETKLQLEKEGLLRAVAEGFTNERVLKRSAFERVSRGSMETWMKAPYAKAFMSEHPRVKSVFLEEAARRRNEATKRQKLEDALHSYNASPVDSSGPRLNNPTFRAESNAEPGGLTDESATGSDDESATGSEDESGSGSEDESATNSKDDDHHTGSSSTTLPAYEAGPSVEAAPVVQKARKTRSDKGKKRTVA
ncbi:hypothetical protein HDU88_008724 [Geranomyces variabilis]|nr:hypothetical protein HDU88_008724 [Geranomyces variabilis]